jgi:hypothetical protein
MILKNIKGMFRHQKVFLCMILLTQILGSFAVCFSVGILYNNQYKQLEDAYSTMQLYVNFSNGEQAVSYEELEPCLIEIGNLFEQALQECSLSTYETIGNSESSIITAYGTWNGSSFLPSATIYDVFEKKIYEGRCLTETDYEEQAAVVCASFNQQDEEVLLGNRLYSVVGRWAPDDDNTIVILLPITAWPEIPVGSVEFQLLRIPSYQEYKKVGKILEAAIPGRYELSEYYGVDADMQAFYMSLSMVMVGILVVMIGTLWMLYSRIYDQRKRQITIFQLCGCKRGQQIAFCVGEALLLALPASVVGMVIFALMRKNFLDEIYLYLPLMFQPKVWLACFAGPLSLILAGIAVLAFVRSRKTLKEQLAEG